MGKKKGSKSPRQGQQPGSGGAPSGGSAPPTVAPAAAAQAPSTADSQCTPQKSESVRAAPTAPAQAPAAAGAAPAAAPPADDSKTAAPSGDAPGTREKTKAELKAERKAAFEAEQKAKLASASPGDKAGGGKSKAQLKAERRAIQEAQRAAKEAEAKGGDGAGKNKEAPKKQTAEAPKKQTSKEGFRIDDNIQVDSFRAQKRMDRKLKKGDIPKRTEVQRKVGLFKHLHQYEKEMSLTREMSFNRASGLHTAFYQLGLQYADGLVCGSNARCIALLSALYQFVQDYKTPENKELNRDMEAALQPCITFLANIRLKSASMNNAIKYFKYHLTRIPETMPEEKAKEVLCEKIEEFVRENIILAGEAISEIAREKIQNDDVILVYSYSSLVQRVLVDAHNHGIRFRVIVVDGRAKLEGRKMLHGLVAAGIPCSYTLINAASYVMREVTRVFVGAHALLANGYVQSRIGTSQIALIARSHNVPVMVCCETYKFCDRVQTDAFVYNELGPPDELVSPGIAADSREGEESSHLRDWRDVPNLALLNLLYDVTPPSLISMVMAEVGMVPCTSVPVVLRVKHLAAEGATVTSK